jgi:outer membrane protein assembly factor BamB
MRRCLVLGAVAVAAVLPLAGCGGGGWFDWFGGGQEAPLPGTRVSVLELAEALEPDPEIAGLDVVLPPETANADWRLPGRVPSHVGGHLALPGGLQRAWRTDVGLGSSSNRRLINPPIVVDGVVYVGDAAGHVTAVSAGSGEELWQVRAASPFEDSPPLGGGVAFGEGLLFVSTGYGELMALDPANGGLVWREEANAPLRAPPTVADGRVFVVTVDNQLEAYAAATGEPLWNHTGILEPAALLGGAAPAVGLGVVIAPYSSGEIFALRIESGRPVWSDSLTAIRRVGALATLADIRGMPVVDDDRVFAVSHAGRAAAIDVTSGVRAWEQQFGSINMPWVAGGFVYVLTLQADVVALTRDEGRIRWVATLPRWEDPEDTSGPIVWAGPVLAGNRLILVNSEGEGVVLSPYTGEELSAFDLEGPSQIMPVVAGGTLYVLTDNGILTAYR